MPLPTFLIAGASKSGTTALWNCLADHPEVGLAEVKEPRFFTRVQGMHEGGGPSAPTRGGEFGRGLAWYEALFPDRPGLRAWGEASTCYFQAPDAPDLIRSVLPGVRLLFLLRSPVERLVSHYWQERKQGWPLPPIEEMARSGHPRFDRYVLTSAYRQHLERYLAAFPREQILVTTYEAFRDRPAAVYAGVCGFIGVSPDHVPAGLGRRFNEAALPRSDWLARALWRTQGGKAADRVPKSLRRTLGNLRRRIVAWNRRPFRYPELDAGVRAQLLARFEGDIAFVESLLGERLLGWRAPAGPRA